MEFEDVLGACNAVNYAADNQIYIAGHPAFVNYSTSQKISRPGDSDDSRSVNSVLLFTILNPIYSITTVRARALPQCPLPPRSVLPVPQHLAYLCFCRMFFIQSAILVALSRELSSSERMGSRPWWNILY